MTHCFITSMCRAVYCTEEEFIWSEWIWSRNKWRVRNHYFWANSVWITASQFSWCQQVLVCFPSPHRRWSIYLAQASWLSPPSSWLLNNAAVRRADLNSRSGWDETYHIPCHLSIGCFGACQACSKIRDPPCCQDQGKCGASSGNPLSASSSVGWRGSPISLALCNWGILVQRGNFLMTRYSGLLYSIFHCQHEGIKGRWYVRL